MDLSKLYDKDFYEKVKQHFNEPVIVGFEICRIVGYAEDLHDCYMIVRSPKHGKYWLTLVGGYIFLNCLKGQSVNVSPSTGETWDDYWRIDRLLTLNGVPHEEEFIYENRDI